MNGSGIVGDVVSAVLMLTGGLSCLLGALGLVRLPDLPARLQATTKPQTLGLLLILVGVAVKLEAVSAVTLVLVVMFQVITAPVIAQMIGRSAYRTGAVRRADLVIDELGPQMDADRRAEEDNASRDRAADRDGIGDGATGNGVAGGRGREG
ncbi:MAG: monovalent cation/H(+) antiporter subunit G [Pseudonocardia sediminis]